MTVNLALMSCWPWAEDPHPALLGPMDVACPPQPRKDRRIGAPSAFSVLQVPAGTVQRVPAGDRPREMLATYLQETL